MSRHLLAHLPVSRHLKLVLLKVHSGGHRCELEVHFKQVRGSFVASLGHHSIEIGTGALFPCEQLLRWSAR